MYKYNTISYSVYKNILHDCISFLRCYMIELS